MPRKKQYKDVPADFLHQGAAKNQLERVCKRDPREVHKNVLKY